MNITLLVLLIFGFKTALAEGPCSELGVNKIVDSLIENIKQVSEWEIENRVKQIIVQKCSQAPAGENVRFRSNGSLLFTQFSTSYNPRESYYFCKNQAGHNAYLRQVSNQVQQVFIQRHREIAQEQQKQRELERQTQREIERINNPRPTRVAAPTEEPRPKLYKCTSPTYFRIPRTNVTEALKESLILTYPNTICTPM